MFWTTLKITAESTSGDYEAAVNQLLTVLFRKDAQLFKSIFIPRNKPLNIASVSVEYENCNNNAENKGCLIDIIRIINI